MRMKLWDFVKDRMLVLILHAVLGIVSFVYLKICGIKTDQLIFFYLMWIAVLTVYLLCGWLRRKRYFDEIFHTLEELDKPYLISEVLPSSWRLEDCLYGKILRTSNKSVVDAVRHLEREQKEYKEFIENWIHEVKVPITAMSLICGSERSEAFRKIGFQLSVLENDVEKALFYARSDRVYEDYLIRRVSLEEVAYDVIQRNQMYFRMSGMRIEVEMEEKEAYCDDKWLAFILNQILINAVKYKKDKDSKIVIRSEKKEGKTTLSVWDNGIGIAAEELGRVFQKGFTGSNGRQTAGEKRPSGPQATGIGLYLCQKLCRKLDMGIGIRSEEGVYTCVLLTFPDGSSHFGRGEA